MRRNAIAKLLRSVFGIERLRDGQQRVIDSVLDGKDTLAIMPTGSGKSLCYQIPAKILQRHHDRRVAADLADERPARKAAANWASTPPRSTAACRPTRSRPRSKASATARHEIVFCTPERLAQAEFLAVLKAGRHLAGRHRRGALHLAVGPRFPSRLPRDGRLDRRAGPPAGAGADRHRHRRRGRRHRQAAGPPAPERHQHRHLPAQPALQRGAGDQSARKDRRRAAHRARLERLRHRLRGHRQGGRGDAPGAARGRRERDHLSRQAAGARAQGKPGPVHGRRSAA